MSPRSWEVRVLDMLQAVDEIAEIITGLDAEHFKKDRKAILATVTCIQIMGEAANHIPADIREKYPDMPWSQIRGMRNRIAHEYFEIDSDIVWVTCKNDLQKLKPVLLKMLEK